MQIGRLLGEGKVAQVFEAGDHVIKLYRPGVGPEQAQREAMILDALRLVPLSVPRGLGVVEIDGRWGLAMSRAAGVPLAARMQAEPDAAVALLAGLHGRMHAIGIAALSPLKARLADRIGRAGQLGDAERSGLLDRLAALPDGDRLCHGDFHPLNVMVDGDDATIIDWLDATGGPPQADVARAYLLALRHMRALAEPYLAARLAGAAFDRMAVMDWLPVLAAARLAEDVPDEEPWLLSLARGAPADI